MKNIIITSITFISLLFNTGFSQTYDKTYKESCGYRIVKKGENLGYINSDDKLVIPLIYDGAYAYDCKYKLCGVSKNKRRGYVNVKNEVVVPLVHDYIKKINAQGTIIVQTGEKYGLYDYKGKLLAKIEYDLLKNSIEKGLVYFERNGKSGYLDKNGKEPASNSSSSTKTGYDKIYEESAGLRLVKKNEKYGYIDKSNKLVIPIQYDNANFFSAKHKIAFVQKGKMMGYISVNNQMVIPLKYDWISKIYEQSNGESTIKVGSNDKYGLFDITGKEILPVKYNSISDYNSTSNTRIAQFNGNYGIVDGKGKEVLAFEYDEIEEKTNYNKRKEKQLSYYFKIRKVENEVIKYGIFNVTGKGNLAAKYDEIEEIMLFGSYDNEKFYAVKKDHKYGLYHLYNGIITKFEYKLLHVFNTGSEGRKIVGYKSQMDFGYIDIKGDFKKLKANSYYSDEFGEQLKKKRLEGEKRIKKEKAAAQEKRQIARSKEKYTKFQQGGKWGYKNSAGEVVIKPIYDELSDFKLKKIAKTYSYAICKRNGKYGMINKRGINLLFCVYDQVSEPIDGITIVKKGNDYGYAYVEEKQIRFLTEFRYSKAEPFNKKTDLAYVEIKDYKLTIDNKGYINKSGDEVIPPIFDEISKFDKYGYAIVKLRAKDGGMTRTLFGIMHNSGNQNKGTKLVLNRASNFDDNAYLFGMKSTLGGDGSVEMHGGPKLVSKAKSSDRKKTFSEMNGYRDNYIIVFNNTSVTRYVHIKHLQDDDKLTVHSLGPDEIVFYDCKSWSDIYVSKERDKGRKKKALDAGYKSACGTIVKIADYYPELKNNTYYHGTGF